MEEEAGGQREENNAPSEGARKARQMLGKGGDGRN